MSEQEIVVEVHVTVLGDEPYPELIAREMVEDALATRPQKWHSRTWVSQTDVSVRDA